MEPDRIERIDAEQARRHAREDDALLVCAYDDEEKCARMQLDGAISLAELRRMEGSLDRDRELIFYCG